MKRPLLQSPKETPSSPFILVIHFQPNCVLCCGLLFFFLRLHRTIKFSISYNWKTLRSYKDQSVSLRFNCLTLHSRGETTVEINTPVLHAGRQTNSWKVSYSSCKHRHRASPHSCASLTNHSPESKPLASQKLRNSKKKRALK